MRTACLLFLVLNFLSVSAQQQLLPKKDQRPNIIYIYADDLGYAELGSYGQQKIKTPNLDRIAKEGIRFTQHYTSTPVCAPARCMLLTGLHGGHSYIRSNYELGGFADSLPLSTYAAMITYMDKQVGRVLDQLKQHGLYENTIVMFSSDNGTTFNGGVQAKFFNSVGSLRGLKMDVYEGGIRVPFIARWPGKIPAGKVTDLISAQYDMMATLADLTGVQAPANDGISMLPVMLGKDQLQQKHEYLYFEYPEKGGQVAIRMGNWKGVRTNVRQNADAPWELYNLSTDIGEQKDVASQHPEIIRQFTAIAEKEHRCPHIKEWEFIDPKFTPR